MSPSPASEQSCTSVDEAPLLLPVETDIYILPDGRVIVADLPAELAARLPSLGAVEPCEITTYDHTDPAA